VCTACHQYPKTRPKEINSSVKYTMSVFGSVSRPLAPNTNVSFSMTFVTKNPSCARVYGIVEQFEAGARHQLYTEFYQVPISRNNTFSADLPLDKYKPGYCQWVIMRLCLVINHTNYFCFANFDSRHHKVKKIASYVINCDRSNSKHKCEVNSKSVGFNAYGLLDYKGNYRVNINLVNKSRA
jgi:hypothetical protein